MGDRMFISYEFSAMYSRKWSKPPPEGIFDEFYGKHTTEQVGALVTKIILTAQDSKSWDVYYARLHVLLFEGKSYKA